MSKSPIRRRLEQGYEVQYYLRRVLMADLDVKLLTLGQRKYIEGVLADLDDSIVVLEEMQKPPLNTHAKGV